MVRQSVPTSAYLPGVREDALLRALSQLQYLTSEQATRLLYGKSYATTAAAFRELEQHNFVKAAPFHYKKKQTGRPTKVYTLDKKGISYLADFGEHGLENKIKNPWLLRHPLRISDFLISAHLLCKQDPRFTVSEVHHERVLHERLQRREENKVAIQVRTQDGADEERIISPILDAFLVITSPAQNHPIGLEVDLGTEREEKWKAKVQQLARWTVGPYRTLFERRALRIAVLTPDAKRLHQLRTWTRDELQTRGLSRFTNLFAFTDVPPESDPQVLFLTPVWQLAADEPPIQLLQGDSE